MTRFSYTLLLWVLGLPIMMFTAGQALRRGGGRYLLQRLGWRFARRDDRPIWLHATSVGEVLAAQVLVEKLLACCAPTRIVLTTTTATGASIARARLPAEVDHAFLPIDWPGAVARFLRATQPRCALIMETELWPNLYAACGARRIPLLVVNGRISKRTLRAGVWVRSLYREALRHTTLVLARSETDGAAFVALGAPTERVRVIGNIKFAAPTSAEPDTTPIIARPYVLAASTRPDEELRIARRWQDIHHGDRLLVIAPRHPQRAAQILAQLGTLGLHIAVRSRGDAIAPDTDIYLADTLGEMGALMHGALLVFVGGSLVPLGGHNVLEPARAGRAIIFGPHIDNFRDETRWLLQHDAALQVRDEDELVARLNELLADPARAQMLGERAHAAMQPFNNIADRYVESIAPHCTAQPAP